MRLLCLVCGKSACHGKEFSKMNRMSEFELLEVIAAMLNMAISWEDGVKLNLPDPIYHSDLAVIEEVEDRFDLPVTHVVTQEAQESRFYLAAMDVVGRYRAAKRAYSVHINPEEKGLLF